MVYLRKRDLPKSSGPSETRLEVQRQILSTKKSPEMSTSARKVATNNQYVSLRNVTVSDNTTLKNVKQERVSHYTTTRPIKPEPGIFLRHRINPGDKERVWKYVHVSGQRCNQGGKQDCNSQSENEDDTHNDNTNTLPDLPTVIDSSLPDGNSNCGNTANVHPSSITASNASNPTSKQCSRNKADGVVDLVSPPAIECRDFIPSTGKSKTTRNLGDLLCTLNFDVQLEEFTGDKRPSEDTVRNVATSPLETAPNVIPSIANNVERNVTQPSPKNLTTTRPVRTVAMTPEKENRGNTTEPLPKTPLHTHSVTTVILSDSSSSHDPPAKISTKDAASEGQQILTDSSSLAENALLCDDDSNQTGASSQLNSTPRSVVTNPDATELETTNVLLQLGNMVNPPEQSTLDAVYDNSEILPVDSAPLEDFTRDMREQENKFNITTKDKAKSNDTDHEQDTDSNKTVDYNVNDSTPDKDKEKVSSPKGNLQYKQYGIVRQSPKNAPNRSRRCWYCETICHSK